MTTKDFAIKLEEYFDKKSRTSLLSIALALDFFIGCVDYLTGYEVSMTFFYLIPLLITVWFVGKREGIIMSVVCISTIAIADALAGEFSYYNANIVLWNIFLTEGFFLVVAFLSFETKSNIEEKKKLIQDLRDALATIKRDEIELREALENVKTLSGLLPMCASCKKIRDDKGYWTQVDTYISKHTDADFTHGICPECTKKLYPEHYEDLWGKEENNNT